METDDGDFRLMLAKAGDLARRMVDQHGMTAPFAVVVLPDGSSRIIGVESREKSPRLVALMDGLVAALRRQAPRRGYRAVAICSTGYATCVETGETARAILIGMESRCGDARAVAIPYSRGLYDSYVYHDAVEQPGRPVVFVPCDAETTPFLKQSRRKEA